MPTEYKYSTFVPRFWAGFIDGLVFLPVSFADEYLSSPSRATVVLVAWALFSYPVYWVYSVTLHAYRGQTVGKKSRQVRVMDVSEQRVPSLRQVLLRDIGSIVVSTCALVYFIYLVVSHKYSDQNSMNTSWPLIVLGSANLMWFFLEIITMLTNSKRRALHDLIAGTVVVRVGASPVPAVVTPEISSSPSTS